MSKKKKENVISEQDINYNVYNALNLVNEELGENYVQTGFNPFDDEFQLDENYVTEVLKSQKEAEELISPAFINEGPSATIEAFENSLKASEASLNKLIEIVGDPRMPESKKKKLRKLIEYLKMRIQMLAIQIKKLKEKEEQNALEMYQKINALNWYYYYDFEDTFENPEFNIEDHLEHLLDLTPDLDEKSQEVIENLNEMIDDNSLDKQERQEIKEEIKDFIQDIKSGQSLRESTEELYSDVKRIITESKTKEDESLSR